MKWNLFVVEAVDVERLFINDIIQLMKSNWLADGNLCEISIYVNVSSEARG